MESLLTDRGSTNGEQSSDYLIKCLKRHSEPLIVNIWGPISSSRICKTYCVAYHHPPLSSSSSVYLSLKEEEAGEGEEGRETESGSDEVMTESYMTMAQSENCRLVDASIQKNISFDGKPMTPSSWNGGLGEIFSLRDQLKQAEEKASQVQREV